MEPEEELHVAHTADLLLSVVQQRGEVHEEGERDDAWEEHRKSGRWPYSEACIADIRDSTLILRPEDALQCSRHVVRKAGKALRE